jgi:hypothetical protein
MLCIGLTAFFDKCFGAWSSAVARWVVAHATPRRVRRSATPLTKLYGRLL